MKSRKLIATAFAAIACHGSADAQTFTALSAGSAQPFPTATAGTFEYSQIPFGTFAYGPNLPGSPGGSTAWTPWDMGAGTGIAANRSGFVNPFTSPPNSYAPEGMRCAFVQGMGTMTTPYAFGAGSWRLKIRAAQRVHAGAVNRQALRFELVYGGVTTKILELEPSDQIYRLYTTRTFHFPVPTAATLRVSGTNPFGGDNTAFVDLIELEPISDWNASSSWDQNAVPGIAHDVVIPQGVEVALSSNEQARTVTVHGELLATQVSSGLETHWMSVMGKGAHFEIGREGTPFEQDFHLTLLGNSAGPSAAAGTKFLMAMNNGVIDMHGLPKRSWTKLAQILPGNDEILVDDHDGWQPDDWIVVAYTGHVSHTGKATTGQPIAPPINYTGPLSERRQIDSINGNVIRLKTAIAPNLHTGQQQSFPHGQSAPTELDARAEVGMLSHNIVVQGALDPAEPEFGGHVMIMAPDANTPGGFARFSQIELTRMGQKQELGRYPMHWHMQRDNGVGQYMRDSSVYLGHNRAITVHGSNGVEVSRNVCFDIVGHAVFLEDGVEQGNVFDANLVLGLRAAIGCERMLPHDNAHSPAPIPDLDRPQNRTPAAFWISHPNNTFVDNVAADSGGVGYWFALHEQATGESSNASWNLATDGTKSPLGMFEGNVAHSMKMGLDVHDSIAIDSDTTCWPSTLGLDDPRDDNIVTNRMWDPPAIAAIKRLTVYGCTSGIYTGGGIFPIGTIDFVDCVLADNGVHAHFASADRLRNSLLIYDTGSLIFPTGAAGNGMPDNHLHGFERGLAYVIYDGPARFRDSHLIGYSQASGASVYYTGFGGARRHTDHRVSGLTFEGGGLPVIQFLDYSGAAATTKSNQWGFTIVDEDESLNGGVPPIPSLTFPPSLITNHPMVHVVTGSQSPDEPLLSPSQNAYWSPFKWAHLQVRYYAGAGYNTLMEGYNVPDALFTRNRFPYNGIYWNPETFDSNQLPSGQMRQIPVIVRPGGTTNPLSSYTVVLGDPQGSQSIHRADISVDDFHDGDHVYLYIQHESATTWTPQVFLNDSGVIHANATNPNNLSPMTPGNPSTATSTTYRVRTINGVNTIELLMVKPSNGERVHRISIVW